MLFNLLTYLLAASWSAYGQQPPAESLSHPIDTSPPVRVCVDSHIVQARRQKQSIETARLPLPTHLVVSRRVY